MVCHRRYRRPPPKQRRPRRRARRCQSWPSFSPLPGSCRERWRRIYRDCCRRRVRPRARRSPPRRWWARPKSAPGSSRFDYCARSTRSPRRGSLSPCIRMAPASVSLSGPPHAGARIVKFRLLRSFHPISSARLASALHPIGAAFLVAFGAPGIIVFALLHGAGNGMITIAKGTLPLALFGPRGYGLRSGLLSAPARMLQAAAPFLFGLLLDRVGLVAGGLSAGVVFATFSALFLLRPRAAVAAHPSPVRCSGANRWTTLLSRNRLPHGRYVSRGQIGRHRSTFAS